MGLNLGNGQNREGSGVGGYLSFAITALMKVNLPAGVRTGETVPEGWWE